MFNIKSIYYDGNRTLNLSHFYLYLHFKNKTTVTFCGGLWILKEVSYLCSFCFAALIVLPGKSKQPSLGNFLLYPSKPYLYSPIPLYKISRGENQSKVYEWTSLLACINATTDKKSLLQDKVNENEKQKCKPGSNRKIFIKTIRAWRIWVSCKKNMHLISKLYS